MRIFKNTWFTRFAKKEGIKDTELCETVSQLEAGQAMPILAAVCTKCAWLVKAKENQEGIG